MTLWQLLVWSLPVLVIGGLLRWVRRTSRTAERITALTAGQAARTPSAGPPPTGVSPAGLPTGGARDTEPHAPGLVAASRFRRRPGAARAPGRVHRRATAAAWWNRRGGPPAPDRDLPLTTELVAACLAAGASPARAAAAAGAAHRGALAAALATAARELRIGGEPAVAWGRLTAVPGAQPLARRLELADTTGIPAVEAVTAAAAEQRATHQRAAQTAVRRAGVYITGPLGLCFLPAFLLLGVAPVVLGLAGSLL